MKQKPGHLIELRGNRVTVNICRVNVFDQDLLYVGIFAGGDITTQQSLSVLAAAALVALMGTCDYSL